MSTSDHSLLKLWGGIGLKIPKLVAKAWADESFKRAFLADPRGKLAEEGVILPEIVEIQVDQYSSRWRIEPSLDMTKVVYTIPLPPKPCDTTDEELAAWGKGKELLTCPVLLKT